MRRNTDRQSLGTASTVLKRLRDDGSERDLVICSTRRVAADEGRLCHLGMVIVGVPYSTGGMLHTEARGGIPNSTAYGVKMLYRRKSGGSAVAH